MQTDMGGYQPWQAGTSGDLKAYEPTWRDRLARMLMGEQSASPERNRLVEGLTGSRGIGNSGLGLVDFVPGVGQAFQAQEEARKGEGANIIMAAVGGPAAKVPRAAAGAAGDAARGITAYHGSPHDFDRFDLSKIGTGEGAQAYGHGLYFAEAEDVAKSYRDDVSKLHSTMPRIGGVLPSDDAMSSAASLVKSYGGIDEAIAARQGHIRDGLPPATERIYREDLANLQKLKESGASVTTAPQQGRMYEVRINASPDDFLDWDKPLSQQSEKVRGALAKYGIDRPDWTGGQIHESNKLVPGEYMDKKLAAQRLKDVGIPGISYLDQGSRAAGQGSKNYAVFDDKIIDVVKKYGIAFAVSMFGADAVNSSMGSSQQNNDLLGPK